MVLNTNILSSMEIIEGLRDFVECLCTSNKLKSQEKGLETGALR